jgi:hypothetical protein
VIKPALNEMFHHVSAINPNLECILSIQEGDHFLVSSRKKLLTNKINLKPVKEFINDKSNKFIKGDDPLSGFATQKYFRHIR